MIKKRLSDNYMELGGISWLQALLKTLGVIVFAVVLGFVVYMRIEENFGRAAVITFIAATSLMGIAMNFLKKKVCIDANNQVIRWKDSLGKVENSLDLNKVQKIIFDTHHEEKLSSYGSTIHEAQTWSVRLVAGNDIYTMIEDSSEKDVRTVAEDMVRITGVKMENRTGERVKTISTRTVDMPLVEKIRQGEAGVDVSKEFECDEINCTQTDGVFFIYTNPKKYLSCLRSDTWIAFAFTGAFLLSLGVLAFGVWPQNPLNLTSFKIILSLAVLCLLIAFFKVARDLSFSEIFEINPESVIMIRKTLFSSTSETIPIDELEDIRIDMHIHPHIVLDTDRKLYYGGYSLNGRNLGQLAGILRSALFEVSQRSNNELEGEENC